MNKSLLVITLFIGVLFAAGKTEANVANTNFFKGMQTLQNNPWDPREETNAKEDSSGREALPEPEQSEAETEE